MMEPVAATDLESYLPTFRLSAFRPGQREVIAAVLAGQDCLCVMPTGGGKSLCYQLPAVVLDGLTLVVSPLIALMKDQVDQLQALGLPVTFINSTLSMGELNERLDRLAAGAYRLAYVVPERFRSSRFIEAVRRVGLKLLAIDEAHCISEWGHDFRPDYARLGHFRRLLDRPPTIALTATATDAVRRDIIEQLDLQRPRTFITGFARPNLFYEVQSPRTERQKADILSDFLRRTPGAGIVYASTRKRTEEVAETIAAKTGRRTTVYHAGLQAEQRRSAQDSFMDGRAEIVVATTAFGMGIDKADVRFVIHYNLPGSLEAYYQEAGRAGRDGRPSHCLLLFHASDRYIQEYFIESAYPSRENVAKVYDLLRGATHDPIELTQQDIKERLGLPIGAEGVGTCEQLLEGAGVLERLIPAQNMSVVRLDSDLPTMVDLLPKQAKTQRRVLQVLERLVGPRRHELVHFRPESLLRETEMDHSSVAHALRELNRLEAFTYVPPFRGRAIHMIHRELPFESLEIDFDALEQRKAAEYEKLNCVIRFAMGPGCRQQQILDYFGDQAAKPCGHCDNCRRRGIMAVPATESPAEHGGAQPPGRTPGKTHPKVLEAIRMVLSGVARTQARFPCGKNLIAQMLCGSNSARVQTLRLNKLSTFGLLARLTQPEVVALIDALVATGHLEQTDLKSRRPVVQLTPSGAELMRAKVELGAELPIPIGLLAKLQGERLHEPAAGTPAVWEGDSGADAEAELPPADPTLLAALKDWRNQVTLDAGIPAYRVLSNATLTDIARQCPRRHEDLLEIKGIGQARLREYGDALLEIVAAHGRPGKAAPPGPSDGVEVTMPSLADAIGDAIGGRTRSPMKSAAESPPAGNRVVQAVSPQTPTPSPPSLVPPGNPSAQPSHYWTWRLLSAGFSADECQAIRGLSREVVLDHALRAMESGLPVRAEWCLSSEVLGALEKAVGPSHASHVRPLLSQLPAGACYEEVQLFLKCRTQATAVPPTARDGPNPPTFAPGEVHPAGDEDGSP
jgi:ATP-dependent DNA helicase RecQ